MKNPIPRFLWRDRDAARVFVFLLGAADDSGCAVTSLRQVSAQTGVSLRKVRTTIARLVDAGVATQQTTHLATHITLSVSVLQAESATHRMTQLLTQPDLPPREDYESFCDFFNSTVAPTSIPCIKKLTDSRRRALKSIFHEYGRDTAEEVVRKAVASDFLSRKWGGCGFDWIFKKNNFQKILEGNYDNSKNEHTSVPQFDPRRGTDVSDFAEDEYGGAF